MLPAWAVHRDAEVGGDGWWWVPLWTHREEPFPSSQPGSVSRAVKQNRLSEQEGFLPAVANISVRQGS